MIIDAEIACFDPDGAVFDSIAMAANATGTWEDVKEGRCFARALSQPKGSDHVRTLFALFARLPPSPGPLHCRVRSRQLDIAGSASQRRRRMVLWRRRLLRGPVRPGEHECSRLPPIRQ